MGVAISDNCTADGSLVVTSSDGAPSGSCPWTIIRTYTVTDACGNASTVTQTINVDDTTVPTITGTLNVINQAGCSAAGVPAAVNTVAALEAMGVAISDNCTADGSLVVTSSDGAPSGSCPWTIIRTYTVTDACGNASTVTQTINVDDTTVPTITGTLNVINQAGCSAAGVPAAVNTVAALEAMGVAISDNCTADGSLVVTSSDGAPSGSCPWTIIRTYTVTDACGNASTVTQTINVDDTTVPTITGTLNVINQAGCSAAGVPAAVNTVAALEAMGVAISDNCTADGSLVVTSSDGAPSGSCPWTIIRTYTVTDACGNASTVTQTINVDDTTVPTITGTLNVINQAGCSAAGVPAVVNTVAALEAMGVAISDNCTADGSLVVTSSDGAPSGSCPWTIIRTYTVTDACGNASTVTQTINVDDTTVPSITGTLNVINQAGCSAAGVPAAVNTVAALEAMGVAISDNCTADGSLVVTSSDGAPSGSCPWTIIRTYTVTDACGNASTVTQTINVDDTTVPSITGTLNVINQAGCSAAGVPAAVNTVAALEAMGVAISDNCTADGSLVVTSSDGAPSGSCPWTIIRTYTVTDACGNASTVTQTINVDDTTVPSITGTLNVINQAGCSAAGVPAAVNTVAALEAMGVAISDNCTADGSLVVTSSDGAPSGSCPWTIIRTYTVTDACGNASTVTQTINVDDNIAPTASNPAPVSVQCIGDLPVADITVLTDEADNCTASPVVTFVSDLSDGNTCPEIITRTEHTE